MFTGDYNMKLTLGKLRNLVNQVVKENRMRLDEEQIGLTFDQFKKILDDPNPKGGIQRLGIMTAENPFGVDQEDSLNVKHMQDFGKFLDSKGLQYVPIGGKYGNPENSYIILNPSMLDMVEFGKMYGQAVVIFAQKIRRVPSESEREHHFRFDYIQTEPDGKDKPRFGPQEYYIEATKDGIMLTNDDDMYSELDGTKFTIPFFSSKTMPDRRFAYATDPESELKALKGKYDKL